MVPIGGGTVDGDGSKFAAIARRRRMEYRRVLDGAVNHGAGSFTAWRNGLCTGGYGKCFEQKIVVAGEILHRVALSVGKSAIAGSAPTDGSIIFG